MSERNTVDWKKTKDRAQFQVQYSTLYISWFLRWLIFGAITGTVCGLAGAAFHVGIDMATAARHSVHWLLFLLPFAGLLIVFAYHCAGLSHDPGTNLVLTSIQGQKHIPLKMAPLIFCGTILTHLCGGSSGRVGAALQIGGSIGEGLGHLFRLKDADIKIIIICGMSAVFATLFGTPVAAAVFTMEVISVGVIHYSAFVPSIVSASIAYGITQQWDVTEAVFPTLQVPELSVLLIVKIIILAMIGGAVSILFCVVMHRSVELFTKLIPNDYIRVFAGGCAVILCTLLAGTDIYNGHGSDMLLLAMTGSVPTFAFLIKIGFTALTLGTGFKGGEIAPALFVGAALGSTAAPVLGIDPAISAAICMIALFCGVVNCPLAAIIFSVELFGSECLLLFCIACAVSYVFSGYYGLYSSQKIMYDKLHPQFINTHSH